MSAPFAEAVGEAFTLTLAVLTSAVATFATSPFPSVRNLGSFTSHVSVFTVPTSLSTFLMSWTQHFFSMSFAISAAFFLLILLVLSLIISSASFWALLNVASLPRSIVPSEIYT